MTRDDIARAIYIGWSKNKNVAPWEVLGDGRREQWRWAADEVIALLPPRYLDTRSSLVDRLKRSAG